MSTSSSSSSSSSLKLINHCMPLFNGCWLGSTTILPTDEPVILYTEIDPQNQEVQNLVVPKNLSNPYLREWSKSPKNPLMALTASNQINASSFRDPTTAWLDPDQRWRVILTGLTFLPCHCEQTSILLGKTGVNRRIFTTTSKLKTIKDIHLRLPSQLTIGIIEIITLHSLLKNSTAITKIIT